MRSARKTASPRAVSGRSTSLCCGAPCRIASRYRESWRGLERRTPWGCLDGLPLAAIRSLKGKVVHCHVENMAAGVHDHLLPHEGDMDLQAYVAALKEIGFTGGLALDLYKHDYERVAPEAIRFLRQCIG